MTFCITYMPKIIRTVHVCQSYNKMQVGLFWDAAYVVFTPDFLSSESTSWNI